MKEKNHYWIMGIILLLIGGYVYFYSNVKVSCGSNSDCGIGQFCNSGKCYSSFEKNPLISDVCNQFGGHWNECSIRCELENPANICIQTCEPLCECGGISGFTCPPGYHCKLPPNIMDAMGYCI